MDLDHIRNFSIIAHIDHGKSTLADRILELTKTVSGRDMRAQVLDTMEVERERGITIKAQAVRVSWKARELDAIGAWIAVPAGLVSSQAPPRALVFDSSYDPYRRVVAFVRVVDGSFAAREPLRAMAQGTRFEAEEAGFFAPTMTAADTLGAGEVGYVITGPKDVSRRRG